jgi:hypothetical protein
VTWTPASATGATRSPASRSSAYPESATTDQRNVPDAAEVKRLPTRDHDFINGHRTIPVSAIAGHTFVDLASAIRLMIWLRSVSAARAEGFSSCVLAGAHRSRIADAPVRLLLAWRMPPARSRRAGAARGRPAIVFAIQER